MSRLHPDFLYPPLSESSAGLSACSLHLGTYNVCLFESTTSAVPKVSYTPSPRTMAIFPKAPGQTNGSYHSTGQPINIEAWTEQAAESLNAISLSSTGGVRGTSVSLAIPLDEQAAAKRTVAVEEGSHVPDDTAAYRPRREPLRRDSLRRREALLKGKEGSRRRQRWENGSYR